MSSKRTETYKQTVDVFFSGVALVEFSSPRSRLRVLGSSLTAFLWNMMFFRALKMPNNWRFNPLMLENILYIYSVAAFRFRLN